jgi:hypothetical protein
LVGKNSTHDFKEYDMLSEEVGKLLLMSFRGWLSGQK